MIIHRCRDRRLRRCIALLAALLASGAGATIARAQEIAVPVAVQVPIFLKMLSFERNLLARVPDDELVVGVLYQRRYRLSAGVADEVRRLLKESRLSPVDGLRVRTVAIDLDTVPDLAAALRRGKITVLYVAPLRAIDVAEVAAASRSAGSTTLTGTPVYVERGLALGIDIKGERPEIVINLPASRAEGADLAAQLLKLARVIDAEGTTR